MIARKYAIVTKMAQGIEYLFRKNKDETTATYPVRLDRILNRGDLSTNYTVAPGDVIVIPERTF